MNSSQERSKKENVHFRKIKHILGSPCDCKVSVYPIEEKTSFVVKDTRYTLDSLIRNRKIARHFQGGYAVILRLTVDDYHRYCYFDDGIKSENHRIEWSLSYGQSNC